jgi:hypothetical protein
LARETDFIVASLNLLYLFFPNQTAAAKTAWNWRRQLTNTWQTDGLFLRFLSRLFATDKNGKS